MEAALAGGNIIQVYYCVHGAEDGCSCLKPQPGLIRRAQLDYGFVPQNTFFVGDSREDIAAAASAGCPSILVRREAFLEKREVGERPRTVTSNLFEAAQVIIARQRHDDLWMQNPTTEPDHMRSFCANHS
jgi:D-glycero-D-manno-heptose 1,7-bisphosphate phosphatase